MKNTIFAIFGTVILSACGASLPDYAEMTPDQKASFMAKYEKDMMKAYSLANRMGKIKTEIIADPEKDTITSLMTMDMALKGASRKAMSKQINDMMLEQNCSEGFFKDFVDVGITYRMKMVDKNGKTMVNTVVSPKACAKFAKKA